MNTNGPEPHGWDRVGEPLNRKKGELFPWAFVTDSAPENQQNQVRLNTRLWLKSRYFPQPSAGHKGKLRAVKKKKKKRANQLRPADARERGDAPA